MSSEERASFIGIITNLVLNTYIIVRLVQLYNAGALAGEDAVTNWARTVVWVIPATILVTVVLNILVTMFSKERDQRDVVDERDRKFQVRGLWATVISIGLGYTAMMVLLALGWTPVYGLTLLYVSFAAGDLLGNSARLASYRIGC
jgi:hypothetical protein